MTIVIIATVTASIAYFTLAFIAHIAKSVGDRRRPKAQPAPIAPKTIIPTPAKWFRPAPVVQTANLYQNCNIRQLKKLASGRVKKYSNMTKPQLIAALSR